jgi:hypothetical protein
MRTFASKAGWIIAALLGITLVASWTGVISAGSLDPPGPVGSTMKSLDDIPGSWSRMLSADGVDPCATERFDCVLGSDEAVLDLETGIVWEREPSDNTLDWDSAIRACHDRNAANRMGWRLATVSELLSLHEGGSADGLPTGHPFDLGVVGDQFWSSTRNTVSDTRSMRVDIGDASVADDLIATAHRAWCVRGPNGGDVQ